MEETTTVPSETAPATSEATESTEVAMTTEEGAPTEEVVQETTYADGKFKSVGDLENSYKELQSTFSKKLGAFEGSPEAYEFAEGSVTETNQGLADMLGEWGMENQLSNDGMNNLVTKYNEYDIARHNASLDAEMAKLGDDGATRIDNAKSYLEANIGKEATEALAANMNTAAAIEAVEKLIGLNKTQAPATIGIETNLNADKIRAMRFAVDDNGNRKMEDPAYRQRVLKLEQGIAS